LFQEVHDYSTGVFYYDGKEVSLVARATALPPHIFASILSVEAIVQEFGDDIHPGDVFMLNDPYYGGSHQADWTIMKPVFLNDREMLIPSVRAHMSDFGGVRPGGYNPDARDVWQEGFRVPPVRLYERGVLREDLWNWIISNSRLKETLNGDMMAIIGGCNVGAQRTEAIISKYGADVVMAALQHALDYAERRFEAEIAKWPDGVYVGESVLDHDALGNTEIKVRATITVEGTNLSVDFSGSDPQAPGYINSPFGNTASYVYAAIFAVLPSDIPVNSGMFRRVKITAPEGTVTNPLAPSPVMFSTVTIGGDIGEATMKALAEILPDQAGNVGLGYCICTTYGKDARYDNELYFTIEYGNTLVSDGGAKGKDGWGGLTAPCARLIFATVETQELQFPFRYDRYEYIDDSCGAGRWRGVPAFAMRRTMVGENPGYVTITEEGNRHPMAGYAGGHDGAKCFAILKPGTPEEELITESVTARELRPGEAVQTQKGGGGGWGPPHERDPHLVLSDVLDGFVSRETARNTYGVEIVGSGFDLQVDEAATQTLRARMSS
jgi:N-methylhydantoinase B